MGVALVLVFAYVRKPFSEKCAAKDWEALIESKAFGNFPKVYLMGILLAVVAWAGCIGVLVPALMLAIVGPGKGRMFSAKK
jgi:uncharacterized membrane protein